LAECKPGRLIANLSACASAAAVLQGWQLWIGVDLAIKTWPALVNPEGWLEAERCQSDLRGMRGTFLCGLIFAYMAVRNNLATIATITEKRQTRQQQRRQ
jgi:hypothetical protein